MSWFRIIGVLFIFIAIGITAHQHMIGYPLFQWEDLHHETWILMFGFAGIILVIRGKG